MKRNKKKKEKAKRKIERQNKKEIEEKKMAKIWECNRLPLSGRFKEKKKVIERS